MAVVAAGWSTTFVRPFPRNLLMPRARFAYRAPSFFWQSWAATPVQIRYAGFDEKLTAGCFQEQPMVHAMFVNAQVPDHTRLLPCDGPHRLGCLAEPEPTGSSIRFPCGIPSWIRLGGKHGKFIGVRLSWSGRLGRERAGGSPARIVPLARARPRPTRPNIKP